MATTEHKMLCAQIAKELTQTFAGSLRTTNTQSAATINESTAQEVTKFYERMFQKVKELTE